MKPIQVPSTSITNKKMIFGGEGGAVFQAVTADNKPCILTDESAMMSDDLEGVALVNIYEFENLAELEEYIEKRGWRRFIRSM